MLDGGQMNLFRKLVRGAETKKIQNITMEAAQGALQYMQSLPLPHPQKTIELELYDGRKLHRRFGTGVKAQWYLAAFGEDGQGAFNAGYVLKQGQELLRERRISSKIFRQIPEEPADRHCLGVLAIDTKQGIAADARRDELRTEHFLICQKREEQWIEEIFQTAEELMTADMQTGVRVIRKEHAVHIAAGSCFGRNRELSEFHAGIVLGALMTAAEELWIDLAMVNLYGTRQMAGPDYLITICREQERESVLLEQENAQEKNRHLQSKPIKEHQWKYA